LGDDVDISRTWANIIENKKDSTTKSLGYYELKQYNPWFKIIRSKEARLNFSGCRTQVKQMEVILAM